MDLWSRCCNPPQTYCAFSRFSNTQDLTLRMPSVYKQWNCVSKSPGLWKAHLDFILTYDEAAAEYNTTAPSVFGAKHFQSWKSIKPDLTIYQSTNDYYNNFKSAHRRFILCGRFFGEMQKPLPPIDPDALARLASFEEENGFALPLTVKLVLIRRRIYRHIYHMSMWLENYDDLECLQYIRFDATGILMPLLRDEQDVWAVFVLFDAANPVPDPPVYSLSNESFTWGGAESSEAPPGSELLQNFESELVLENERFSIYLEQYAKQAKDWKGDSCSSDDNDNRDSCHVERVEDTSMGRSSKAHAKPRNLADYDSDEPQYEDSGLRSLVKKDSSSSEGEVEWDG